MQTGANEGNEVERSEPSEKPLSEIARPIFLSWEKLRLVYLAVNVTWCLCLALLHGYQTSPMRTLTVLRPCLIGGVLANLCYIAGPFLETYAAWLGWRHHVRMRAWLFVVGTLLTLVLATVVISSAAITGFD